MFTALNGVALLNPLLYGGDFLVPYLLFLSIGVFILFPSFVLRRWHFYRQRLKKQPITAEYDAPAEFTPAEIAFLFDARANDRIVGATVVHLIQRSLLHLKKDDSGQRRLYAGPKEEVATKSYEAAIIALADSPQGIAFHELLTSSPPSSHVHKKPKTISQAIMSEVGDSLRRKDYLKHKTYTSFAKSALYIASEFILFVGIIPVCALWLYGVVETGATDVGVLMEYLITVMYVFTLGIVPLIMLAMLVVYLRSKVTGRDWIITERLNHLWPQITAFRQYIRLLGSGKLQFRTKQMEKEAMRDALAYEVALGMHKSWRKLL